MRPATEAQRTHIAGTIAVSPAGEVHAARMRIVQHLHRAEGLCNERRQLRIEESAAVRARTPLHSKRMRPPKSRRGGLRSARPPQRANPARWESRESSSTMVSQLAAVGPLGIFSATPRDNNACGQVHQPSLVELALLQQQVVRQGEGAVTSRISRRLGLYECGRHRRERGSGRWRGR